MKPDLPSSKTLLLLRHAKSSWKAETLNDFARPLSPRGRRAAPIVGRYLAAQGLIPEMVLCSPAQRTQETWGLISAEIDSNPAVEMPENLYGAGAHTILENISNVDESIRILAVIGHLPGIDALALNLSRNQEQEDWQRMHRKFPTAGLAVIRLKDRRWDQVHEGCGVLDRFVTPKDLQRAKPE